MAARAVVRAVWVLILGALFVAGMEASVRGVAPATAPAAHADVPLASPAGLTGDPSPEQAPRMQGQSDPHGEPVRVVIPAIGVDAFLGPVGRNDDGSMVVPEFGQAGWYSEGPRPGHAGPSAIVAHVDSKAGPDVFFRLAQLTVGDEVRVEYDSGDAVTFLAASLEQAPKDQLPVDTIWPATSRRMLTLITCGGEFDASSGHYRDNVILHTAPQQ